MYERGPHQSSFRYICFLTIHKAEALGKLIIVITIGCGSLKHLLMLHTQGLVSIYQVEYTKLIVVIMQLFMH